MFKVHEFENEQNDDGAAISAPRAAVTHNNMLKFPQVS